LAKTKKQQSRVPRARRPRAATVRANVAIASPKAAASSAEVLEAFQSLARPGVAAARSVKARLKNKTAVTLTFKKAHLYHGIISKAPPSEIAPGASASWTAESNGAATGTEGYLLYKVGGNQKEYCLFYWDNPFIGGNEYFATAPNPYETIANGDGNSQAKVTYTLKS
jgi:hypothetical protein